MKDGNTHAVSLTQFRYETLASKFMRQGTNAVKLLNVNDQNSWDNTAKYCKTDKLKLFHTAMLQYGPILQICPTSMINNIGWLFAQKCLRKCHYVWLDMDIVAKLLRVGITDLSAAIFQILPYIFKNIWDW